MGILLFLNRDKICQNFSKRMYFCITFFNHEESSFELKVKTKNSLQLFYLIAVRESDMSDALLRSRLKCPIEPAFF